MEIGLDYLCKKFAFIGVFYKIQIKCYVYKLVSMAREKID